MDIEEVGLFSKALAHTNKNRVTKGDLVECKVIVFSNLNVNYY